MVFSSLPFLFGYLPLTLLAYFITPLRWRNAVLLVVSLSVTIKVGRFYNPF